MRWSFTLLSLVNRLHYRLMSELPAIYSTSWVAHSSMIRMATLFLPDYGHCCRMRVLLGGSHGVLSVLRICTGIWVRRPGLMQRSLLGAGPNAWIYLYFSMFAPPVRPGTEACKRYIQQFPMLGYKNENKLLNIRLKLDVMTADEVEYRTGCRRFGLVGFPRGTYIPAQPIQPQEARKPPNNKMYVLRNTFVRHVTVFRPFHRVPARMITWVGTSPKSPEDTEFRQYSQWLSLTGSSRYATPGSVGFDCT
ncbi:hypothetical protein M9H77_13418 [Catharanthus roseus]|uniref:Uncharacterized protein n=1 Tax=Catharanthus roseus TaxID=4058 RepID=A0ACC0BK20_CATRO|nr:hypothetical protein M9H77_13418 [Catharanthus roseus]